jgi:germination protein M
MIRQAHPTHLIVTFAVLLLVAACAAPSGSIGPVPTPPPTSVPSLEPPSAEPTPEPSLEPSLSPSPPGSPVVTPSPAPTASTTIRAYFFMADPATGEPGLVPVLRVVPATLAVGRASMEALLAGPNDTERAADPALVTTVPAGTTLLGLTIQNRIATVDLSREFESGGGSESILGRLAQVVYTLTQFSSVDTVQFRLDGQPVTVFGGEGVLLEKPVGREDFRESLPEIFVDRPAWGAALGNPGRVTGLTRVFEATFQVQLLDSAGSLLANRMVMADCGTGCWGSFDVTLSYGVDKSCWTSMDCVTAQWGTLRVFDYSARDGTPENLREYPVWLTPAG